MEPLLGIGIFAQALSAHRGLVSWVKVAHIFMLLNQELTPVISKHPSDWMGMQNVQKEQE